MDESFGQYLRSLAMTEWLPLSQLARYQRQLVERLVRHAYENVPFYRDRLDCLFTREGHVDLSRWNEVPIFERAEAAPNMDRMRLPQLPESYGEVWEMQTSGTLGIPLRFTVNGLVTTAANAAFTRLAHWFGADTSRPLASIRIYQRGNAPQYPEGSTSKGWSNAHPDADSYSLDLLTPVDQQLEWLQRRRAPYLATSSSNAMALAYAASPAQARELGIELIFAFAETVTPLAREFVSERFGVRFASVYSCQEIGYIATECPIDPHYHVVAENAVVEILDDDGTPVGPGETGRVVLTGLYNYATPFIRYAVGDVATTATGPCRCGRSLPVIAQVEGRTRSAFVFRDGTRMWPRIWDARALQAFVPFREFQMVQLDHERIELRYVPDGSGRAPDLAGLKAHAREKIHPSVEMVAVQMDAIPRGPGGKLEHFVSLVAT